jgi:hypothetical protein
VFLHDYDVRKPGGAAKGNRAQSKSHRLTTERRISRPLKFDAFDSLALEA